LRGARTRTVTYLVGVGSGHYGPREFTDLAEATSYFETEMAVPSYMGPNHRRQGYLTKSTLVTERLK
jgi:hypothetical protein